MCEREGKIYIYIYIYIAIELQIFPSYFARMHFRVHSCDAVEAANIAGAEEVC